LSMINLKHIRPVSEEAGFVLNFRKSLKICPKEGILHLRDCVTRRVHSVA